MGKRGRRFSKEFKLEAVRLMVEEGRTQKDVSLELGVNPQSLYRWRQEFEASPTEAFPGQGNRKETDRELHELRRENAKLKAQVAFLKKVSAYFAKDGG
jgi:transposase